MNLYWFLFCARLPICARFLLNTDKPIISILHHVNTIPSCRWLWIQCHRKNISKLNLPNIIVPLATVNSRISFFPSCFLSLFSFLLLNVLLNFVRFFHDATLLSSSKQENKEYVLYGGWIVLSRCLAWYAQPKTDIFSSSSSSSSQLPSKNQNRYESVM